MRRVLINTKTGKVLRVCATQGHSLSAHFNLTAQAKAKRKEISIGCYDLLTHRVIGDTITATDLGNHHFGEKWAKV